MTAPGESERTGRLVARVASIMVGTAFLGILGLAVTNEDPPSAGGMVVLVLLALELAACAAAWRWERAGGLAIVAGATALAAAAWCAAPPSPGNEFALVAVALYGLPFLLVGLLFVAARGGRGESTDSQITQIGHEDDERTAPAGWSPTGAGSCARSACPDACMIIEASNGGARGWEPVSGSRSCQEALSLDLTPVRFQFRAEACSSTVVSTEASAWRCAYRAEFSAITAGRLADTEGRDRQAHARSENAS